MRRACRVRNITVALPLVALASFLSTLIAGGPWSVNGLGEPMAWDTTGPVVYNPDPGPLGLLSNAQARALLAEAFTEWAEGPSDITFSQGALLSLDVNAAGFAFTNSAHYQNFYRVDGDGLSPVIFDHDGSIIETLFGIGARFEILGVAAIDTPISATTTITGASIIINGAFYDGVGPPASPEDVTLAGLRAAMVHEIGHFINLDHSMLNYELAMDDNAGNDIYVPTMFPLTVQDEETLAETNPDDELAAQNLYPAGLTDRYIQGNVTAGGIPFQGANVVIRKQSDPLMSAYSLISGGRFFPCNPASACNPCTTMCDPGNPPEQGSFVADFFPTDDDYTICVEQIDTRFSLANDTFVGPLATPPIMPGPEECYDSEESFMQADDPDDVDSVAVGSPPADIALNALPLSDPFEPNNTPGTGAPLADLPGGQDTAPGILGSGDLDVFNVPVTAGQRVRIDIDAAEMGSALDAVIGFYNASNALVATSDDAIDPDSQAYSRDPALELIASFTGTAKVVVSSFPDLDQDGSGGGTTGGYWIRVAVATDTDTDGAPDGEDVCPSDPRDDTDRDGLCFNADNCPTYSNPSQLEPTKFNGTLTTGGAIGTLSRNGNVLLYQADQDTDEVVELYGGLLDAGPAIKINGPLVSGGDVGGFTLTPDATTVVYRADQDTDEVFELYSVPLGGGTPVKLNGTLVAGGDMGFSILPSPDSTRISYIADQDTDEVQELYSVPIGGGTPIKLNASMVAGGDVTSIRHFGSIPRVIYFADQDTDEVFELYSVPVGGGTPIKLNGSLAAGGDVSVLVQATGDGSTVLYLADQDTDNVTELYSVPIAGGTSVKLNGSLVTGANVTGFLISFDGATVVYRADQAADEVFELYSVPIGGGTPVKLNGTLVTGGDVQTTLRISPDNSRVIYRADQDTDNVTELYIVPTAGGTPVKLNAPLPSGGNVTGGGAATADGTRVLYVADQATDEVFEYYSVPIAGGTPTRLNAPLVAGGDVVISVVVLDDPTLYRADQDADEVFEIYTVPVAGGTPTRLNANLPPTGDVNTYIPGVSIVVYSADKDTDGLFELYTTDRIAGSDTDGDGVLNGCDLCKATSDPAQDDSDGNGLGDACQSCALGTDPDGDDVCGTGDNCPTVVNANQTDSDADGAGNACDADDDNDGLADEVETDTGTFVNGDNTGTDPLDADSDDDGVSDGEEVASGTNPNSATAQPSHVPFGPQRIISTSASGAFASIAADVDGDGDVDVLSASETDDKVAWYENTDGVGTFGSQQVITTLADGARSVFAADVDGDGDIDALSASQLDDKIAWYENDGASPPGWTARTISTGADVALSVFAADVDGDGDMDVLSASNGDDKVAWYENDGASPPGWTARTITTSANGCRSVYSADVDGDGDVDVLSASEIDDKIAWYENDGASPPGWTARTITTATDGALSVHAADLDGDGDVDVLSASTIDDKVAWHENDGASPPGWTARTITTAAGYALSVHAADLDDDGDMDALSASFDDDKIAWYENDEASPPGWTAHLITTAANGSRSVFAADVDGDGDLDTLSASQLDNRIAWYENLSIHRNAEFGAAATVTSGVVNNDYLIVADVNGDGKADLLSSSYSDDRVAWYQSDGSPSPAWTMRNISTAADGVEYIAVADVNGDGYLDVLSASSSDDTVAWYENNGAAIPGWTERDITTTLDGASAVTAADLDRDGDIDVIASSAPTEPIPGYPLVWYESDGAATPGWTPHDITATTSYQHGLATADFDRDGDLDFMSILASSYFAWYENNGASPPVFTEHVILTNGAGNNSRLVAADVDGDGDMDAVSAYYSTASIVLWLENLGGAPLAWTQHDIPSAGRNNPIDAGDIDADGDVDFLSASHTAAQVEWWENDGAADPNFTSHVVALSTPNPAAVAIGDVNGDGAPDLFARTGINTIGFWLNQGGQYALETTMTAPGSVDDGSTVPLLSIELTSNGRPADREVELGSLEMLLTRSSGVTLTSDEANALIARLVVYRDEGAPGFQPGSDLPVATVDTLALSPLRIDFEAGDPRVRVAGGDSVTFLVVAEMALDASAKSPNSFRIVHIPQSAFARDAVSGVALRMQSATSVTSPTITAGGDVILPYVTRVYPPHGTTDASLMTNVVVFFSEPVTSTSAVEGVALYSGGLKVPALLRVNDLAVTINPESSLGLNADYVVQVTSAVRDRDGNPVVPFSASFDTTGEATAGTIEAAAIVDSGGGAALAGPNADDASGFAATAVGDVNATAATGGIADLIIGAPNADAGAVDAGRATLVFGSPALRGDPESVQSVTYRTATAGDFVGETVAQGGDLNRDGIQDFLIGAPRSDQTGADAGVVYLVFGNTGLDELSGATLDLDNLASCSVPTLCGVKLTGAATGHLAGAALSWAGDVNGDRIDDIVVGAPGANPGGRLHAGSVYLIYGPLAAGTIDLGDVGSSVPGLVFNGEAAGDNAGAAVSQWRDQTGDGLDDLLIGAPGADALNAFGVLIGDAGYVYAIQGGLRPGHLDDTATPGVIELSRVASGDSDQVAGMVFLGDTAGGSIGRSLTGAVDVDGDGVMDILVAGDGVAFLIPGDGPKTITGATPTPGSGGGGALRAGLFSAIQDFGAIMFLTGDDDPLTIGPAGDLNNDGYDDFIIGAPLADGPAGTDAGRAFVVLGSPALSGEVIDLDDVGDVIAGFTVEGAAPGDNLGASVGGGHDVNGDGIDDAIAGAPFADTDPATPANAGETYVISPLNPEEVVSLMLYPMGGGVTRLEWSVPDQGAIYNVYSGMISGLQITGQVKTSNMTQLACGISTDADSDQLPDYDDSGPAPPPGDAWFYLVTASNFQGEGPLGPPGALPQRINDFQCP